VNPVAARLPHIARSSASALRRTADRLRGWLRGVGTYRDGDGTRKVPVPGTSRSIPLYLLAPGAHRGPRAMVACAAMVFGSMLATSATAWAVVAQALAGQDGTVAGRLAVVAIVLWVAALFVADFAWIRRPRTRPLNSDLARW
jgi:hypothetical protein